MIETDEQRRWWFATHPEYSWSRKGAKTSEPKQDKEASDKVRPEDVDAYVDNALKYADEDVAYLLKSVKKHFGTEGSTVASGQTLARVGSNGRGNDGADDDSEDDSFGKAYAWARKHPDEALDLSLSYLLGPLAGTKRVQRAIRSLEKQLAKHEQKLSDYIRDPDAHDNRGHLRRATTPEIRQEIIDGRIKVLKQQIKNFKVQINRLKGGGN